MHDRPSSARTPAYDWTRFGRHRLRAPAGVLVDSPLLVGPHLWLGTLWPSDDEPCGWSRMLWHPDHDHGGWTIPARLAGGDVLEFGADHDGHPVRWYGIVDSYDAAEWLTVQGPHREPASAYEHAQELVGQLRYAPPLGTRRTRRDCTRRPATSP